MAYIQQQQTNNSTTAAAIGADASAVMAAAAAAAGACANDVQIAQDGYESKHQVHITVATGVSDDTTDTESNQAQPTSGNNAASIASGVHLQNNNNNNNNNNNANDVDDDDDDDDSDGGGGGGGRNHGAHGHAHLGANGSGRASISGGSGTGKSPNSYKYPLLRRYFEFGPWVGRNRKALCLGCRQQTSSSQPDRLLRHLNRCNALTDEDKAQVADLMNERTANKRRKPGCKRGGPAAVGIVHDDGEGGYFTAAGDAVADHSGIMDDILNANTSHGSSSNVNIPQGNLKRLKRDSDKHSHIDEALTRFIVLCRIPLKVIHSREFVDLARALNPDYQIPSRETITNVLIPGLLNIL